MPEEIRLGASGLWTDPSELQAPPGALREALNVRIRRPNVIEPRPGFPYQAQSGLSGNVTIIAEWQGGLLVVSGTELWHVIEGGARTEITDPDGASLSITYANCSLVRSEDAMMVTTDDGVFFINEDLSTYTIMRKPPDPTLTIDATGSGFAASDKVAVRVLFARELASGRYLFSAPSDPVEIENDSGGTTYLSVKSAIPEGVIAGDVYQVYRTTTTTGEPGDEMYLDGHAFVTSSDISSGYVSDILMSSNDNLTGAALYTNETQQGILQANDRPPAARRLAWYNQMAFFGDCGPEWAHEYRTYVGSSTNLIAIRTVAASYASSATVSLTSGTVQTGWVGMYLSDSTNSNDPTTDGTYVPAYTKITAVDTGANTFTISNAALATGNDSSDAHPCMTIAGVDFVYITNAADALPEDRTWRTSAQLVETIAYQQGMYAEFRNVGTIYGPNPGVENGDLFIGADSAFTVELFAEQSGEYVLGTFYPDNVYNSTAERRNSARLMWSKTLQPESVPAVNYIDIGSSEEPILGLATTRDSLFVLKTDGVWRVTGNDPESIRIDEFDRSLRIIHPRAFTTYQNDVWLWSTHGIVKFNDGGSQSMSDTTIRDAIEPNQLNVYSRAKAGTYIGGCFMGSCATEGVVVVGVPAIDETATNAIAEYAYVYEARTGAWVRWQQALQETSSTIVWTSFGEDMGSMVFGGGGGGLMWADSSNYDFSASRTITGAASNVEGPDGVTYPGFCDAVSGADVGYRLIRGGNPWVLFSAPSGETLSANISNGAATLQTPYECRVEWVALTAGNPAQLAHWRDVHVMLGDATALPGMTFGFETERVPTEGTIQVRTYLDPDRPDPIALRGRVTRAHARAKRLRVRMSAEWAGQSWRLEGIAITVQPLRGGERTP